MNPVPFEGAQAVSPESTEVSAQPEVSSETRPERVVVSPDADSRLEALHSLYQPLKEAEAEAKRKFKELKEAIAAELEAMYPEGDRPTNAYQVPASIYGPELMVYYKSQEYMPDSVIREHFPEIWKVAHRTKTYTEVRAAQQRSGGRRR